jgi:hypothetical protein
MVVTGTAQAKNTFIPFKSSSPATPKWLLNLLKDEKFMAGNNKGLSTMGER